MISLLKIRLRELFVGDDARLRDLNLRFDALGGNEAQFYVTMSRGRRAMYLFTDSKTALKEAVMRTPERVSAYELLGEGRRGFEP